MRSTSRSLTVAAVAAVALAVGTVTASQGSASATALDLGAAAHPAAAHPAVRHPSLHALRTTQKSRAADAAGGDVADLFAPNNAWKLRADSAPGLAPDSDAQVANLARQVDASVGQRAHVNAYEYNTAIYVAKPGTPRVRVAHNNCQGTGLQGEMYTGRKIFENVPIPQDAVPATGTDGQMTVYDPESDMLWDFWVMNKGGNGEWNACWGGRIDDVSANRGYFRNTEGASASGTAIAGGAITVADVERGHIDHALNLNIRDTAGWQNWMWPAQRADGTGSKGWGSLHQGQRLRLDPSVDVDSLQLPPLGRMIAKAAQEYGFVVTDTSPTVSLVTESGSYLKATTGKDPWDRLLGGPEWNVLEHFPWEKMQALPAAYGE